MKTLTLLFPLIVIAVASAVGTTTAGRDMPELIRLPTSVSNATRSNDDSILDSDGNKVEVGTRYYVTSFIWGAGGGGVKLGHLNSLDKCPSDVIQSRRDIDLGDPIEFIPENESDTVITASTNLLVTFNTVSNRLCVGHQAWALRFDAWLRSTVLIAGDTSDAPTNFRIEPASEGLSAYKLTLCSVNGDCNNVGKLFDRKNNVVRLGLVNDPFMFIIKKVDN